MRQSVHVTTPQTALSAGDEGRLIAELRSLKSQRSRRGSRAAKAMQIIENTNSSRVRNAAALALADLRAANAKDVLIDLLTRSNTIGSRGTLLYALEQLGANVPLPVLADVISSESYEAREEAVAFIVSNRFECSADEFARSKAKLETAAVSADAERLQAIRRALGTLSVKHHHNVRR
jgi:HEAT repeat protein